MAYNIAWVYLTNVSLCSSFRAHCELSIHTKYAHLLTKLVTFRDVLAFKVLALPNAGPEMTGLHMRERFQGKPLGAHWCGTDVNKLTSCRFS